MTPVLCALAAAALATHPGSIRLASPGLRGVNVATDLLGFYGEHLAQRLREQGVGVVTARDIETLLGLERQRQLLGCADESEACMAELASALGVDGSLVGDLARLGDTFQLNLKVVSSRDAQVRASYSGQAASEKEVLARLDEAARRLSEALSGKHPAIELAASALSTPLRRQAWIPAAAGAALAGAGALFVLQSEGIHRQLADPNGPEVNDPEGVARAGWTYQGLGRVGLGLGTAGLAAAGAMYFLGGAPVQPRVAVGPDAVGLALSVELP
ncbi:MAG: hypothetical protein HYZ28_09335 [Myxococcales bacterium]|nr:hypothetical protein [Myxococcales bacterium]